LHPSIGADHQHDEIYKAAQYEACQQKLQLKKRRASRIRRTELKSSPEC
jgi:hypothetical protein